ncbi:HlyD family efflux transporter periplasmic adaptor subunit [Kitasatospora sp. MAP5-34]|uniref:HlyD family efflux transporter periplasmic adaptor subunit n=1 Tax=Kitasatospora sp. MAP5-34 TaxID=3035102 RepID=UPI0024772353|nr:HlyD family efflux transporter periplasmic adaptor subunit [Kitasatospora sp. MAP5-34]MDH6574431.1 multidrug efflux pump subunit AcrA (membrane-fusion protein) [Kitasatospora sp. MAP5-34]
MAKSARPARGMNAALASGEAGVGEIRPVRTPLGFKQLAVALCVAVGGTGIGVWSYHAIASRPVSFSGEVTPDHAYYLDFPTTGTVQTLTVRPGDHVKAGQVLATQVSSVAAANLAAAQAAVAADTALVAEDRNPQTTGSQLAQNQLDVAKAQAAADSAQGALALVQNSAQNAVTAQTAVVGSDQTTLDNDTTRYAQYCSTPAPGASPGASPAALMPYGSVPVGSVPSGPDPKRSPSPSASVPSRSPSPSPSRSSPAPSPSPSGSTPAEEQFCQGLQSQIDKDSAALALAKANLGTIQSSNQAQEQQDVGSMSRSQSVLQAAQARVGAQGTALTPAAIAQAQSQLASAQAQLAADELALRQTSIVAPADGIVADTAGAAGDIVGPEGVHSYAGPAAQSGTLVNQEPGMQLFVPSAAPGSGSTDKPAYSALITVYSGALSVTAQLPESEIAGTHQGQAATLAITATGRSVPGRVSRILLDPARVPSATYYDVTITMDTQQPDILPGMSVDVALS